MRAVADVEDSVIPSPERRSFSTGAESDEAERRRSDGRVCPYTVLQPLVENASEHGVARRGGDGRVEVWAQRHGPQLVLDVIDDGPGPAEGERREGIGLSNTRERLEQLYGSAQSIDLESPPEGGFRVTITIPYIERRPPSRSMWT